MNPDWLIPQWPVPPHVHAVCTTRTGGQSVAPYASLNFGDHVGDHPLDVGSNRAVFHKAIGAKPVFLSQVHGTVVLALTDKTPHGSVGDASITSQQGVACTIMVADCLPILLTDERGSFVAAAHAGWRGLAGTDGHGVLESLFADFQSPALAGRVDVASKKIAWLGPCIGPDVFEVGPEVKAAFVLHQAHASQCFAPLPQNKWLANLPGLARQRLQALGITEVYGNDGSRPWCTVSNPSRFFSYRRSGITGRMAASIWLG
ncbi:MAG: peptidoglycan editing factor PgeF [Gammaproteobacteria bacterium]|nr:peptidoglycan editing factor PgeF [Gammaproteobacteria bacterium]MBU0786252.1 peptidoglycan editing factor PgeF [Gammaproteobacteria bacterium]MBU0814528.1 peptidoglycan editing factor PgeF [Gammaproteobacteria bacterium]MBU1786629.1 peptidoglycan editing factor PgeF [Gammaproteobacteria bacterium]